MFDSSVTPWTVVLQDPLSMGFPRKEYWGELPFPSPGDLPDSGIKLVSPALAGRSLPPDDQGSPRLYFKKESHLLLGTIKTNVMITQPFSEHL